jgi:antitoxin MazE
VKTTIKRWGNSLALRIPKAFAQETRVKNGTAVELALSDGALVVRPTRRTQFLLKTLLAQVNSNNRHGVEFDDSPRGKEAW